MDDQYFSLIFVVDSLLAFNLTFFQKVRFCSASRIKELMLRSVVSSCNPSEEVPNLVADADEEHLNVLEGSGSKMPQDAIQTGNRIEANESVTRVTEGLHCFINQLVLITLHCDFKGVCILVFSGNAAFAHRFFYAHQHLQVLEVLDLGFNLQLLRKVRNDQYRSSLTRLLLTVALLPQDVVEVPLDSISGSILWKNTFNMESSGLQALVILVLAHVLIVTLERHFSITSCLLDDSYSQQRKDENDGDAHPCSLLAEHCPLGSSLVTKEGQSKAIINYS